jgi:hypothetical protein
VLYRPQISLRGCRGSYVGDEDGTGDERANPGCPEGKMLLSAQTECLHYIIYLKESFLKHCFQHLIRKGSHANHE